MAKKKKKPAPERLASKGLVDFFQGFGKGLLMRPARQKKKDKQS